MKKGWNIFLSLVVGFGIFGFFLYKVSFESLSLMFSNIHLGWLSAFFAVTVLTFFPATWRWKVILKAHKKKVRFWPLFRYGIAGYAISYMTPAANVGGEPMKIYMLKKEQDVDLRTGSSTMIIDKFVELLGTSIIGLVGFILFLTLPGLTWGYKTLLGVFVGTTFFIVFITYYRTISKKGSISSLFISLRLNKISKFRKIMPSLVNVERKMEDFFAHHKKEFWIAMFTYVLYTICVFLEFKFLLLSFGVNESVKVIILAMTLWGISNFMPVPAGLGFLEAGQTSLFSLLKGEGEVGFALSLLIRLRALIFVAIGFTIISYFSGKQLNKEQKKNI